MPAVLDRAISSVWVGMLSFGAGVTTVAQGVFDPSAPSLERWIGGGTLIAVAVLIVRWSRQMGHEVRDTLTTSLDKVQLTLDQNILLLEQERNAWHRERAELKKERSELRLELQETYALLREERNLRLSLEKAGITDRRAPRDPPAPDASDLG